MMAQWITATVVEVKHWTDALFSLVVKAPISPFIAGQFAKLGLVIDGERVQRAYSYVNAPQDDQLEFYLIEVPEGKLSPALKALQPGDSLEITEHAAGFLVLDEIPDCQNLWMLATGTAIGPYLSILQQGVGLERFEHLVLVHAVRYAEDLSYLPLMQQLEAQYQGKLKIITVVSREQHASSLKGRLPALIESGELEAAVGLELTEHNSHLMLCGNPHMVRDTQQLLKTQRGMRKHLRRKPGHMTSEHYW